MTTRIPVSTAEGYARWAASYDDYPNGLIRIEEPIVQRLCGDVTGKRVLDAGCGTGRHTRWLVERGARVVGIDPSPEMLAIARIKCPGAELFEGAFADAARHGTFDLVVNALVLEHVADMRGAIAALAGVLAPGGRLVVSVYHPFFLLKGVPPHFRHTGDGVEYELPSHVHLVSDYVAAIRAAGLTLGELLEPIVDDALVAALPNFAKHRGHPLAVIFAADR
jgi:SAM-dependent methyltransferase